MAIDGAAGATEIEVSAAAVTVSVAVLLVTPPKLAVMLDVPTATAVARPELLMVAVLRAEEFQAAEPERFCVLASE